MHPKAIRRLCAAVAGLVCALAAGSAHAQNKVILNQPFDATDGFPDIPYHYAYQSGGSVGVAQIPADASTYYDTSGPGGSRAQYMYADSSNVTLDGGGNRYWGMGLGNFILIGADQPTGLEQSDYVWSADVRGVGVESGGAQSRFRVQFQVDTNGDGAGENVVDLRSPNFTLTNDQTHFTSNLASWFPEGGSSGSWADFQNVVRAGTRIIGASIFLASDDGAAGFGYDSGNEFHYDNLRLEQIVVPEPAAVSVLAVAGLIALGRRRQRP
jgi:hypothetical protein